MSRSGMQPARVYRAEAIVLRRSSFGETDRALTLFTRELGKLRAVAKGARGARSRLSGATEPFTCFQALLAQGTSMDVLTQAQVRDSFPAIRKDLVRVGYASYFLELVDAGTAERQPLPDLWDLLAASLQLLEEAATPDVLARAFELHALCLLGFEPQLDACALDGAPVGERGAFHPLKGGVLCPRCANDSPGTIPLGPNALAAFRRLPDEPLPHAAHSQLSNGCRRALARCLVPYVRHHLEAPLRSLSFLDHLPPA